LEWRDRAYEETLESVLAVLETRKKSDPSFSLDDAEAVLKHLYIQEGNDQGAHGPLQDATSAAVIAAYEEFINLWKAGGA
jgi:hypothetical protein